MEIIMTDLPEECEITVEHALDHAKAAIISLGLKDYNQVTHDLAIVTAILQILYDER